MGADQVGDLEPPRCDQVGNIVEVLQPAGGCADNLVFVVVDVVGDQLEHVPAVEAGERGHTCSRGENAPVRRQGVYPADGHDDHIDATLGGAQNGLRGVRPRSQDQVGAGSLRNLMAPDIRLDGDDGRYSLRLGEPDVHQAERAATNNQDGIGAFHLRDVLPVEGTGQRFHQGRFLGRYPAERNDVLAGDGGHLDVLREPPGELVAEGDPVPADVGVALAARGAFAARYQRIDADLVAESDAAGERAAGVDDLAGGLVSEHRGKGDVLGLPAGVDAKVCSAKECRRDLDEDFALGQLGNLMFLDPKVVGLIEGGLFHRGHGDSIWIRW